MVEGGWLSGLSDEATNFNSQLGSGWTMDYACLMVVKVGGWPAGFRGNKTK